MDIISHKAHRASYRESILSPLVYIIYTSTIENIIPNKSSVLQNMDDTVLNLGLEAQQQPRMRITLILSF